MTRATAPAAAPVPKPVKVALSGLKLTNFRNYASLSLEFAAPPSAQRFPAPGSVSVRISAS